MTKARPYQYPEGNQQPPPYQDQGSWQGQSCFPSDQQQQMYLNASASYYGEKQEYSSPPHGAPQALYQPQYPQQPQYGGSQSSYYGQQNQPYPSQPQYGTAKPAPYGSNFAPPQVPHASYSGPAPQTEEQRGMMGALGGAAAGGFAGHKMGHGVIGALGGVFTGHKLEDAYKNHHKKPSPSPSPIPQQAPYQQYHPPPPQNPHYSVGGLALRGNFSASSTSITLDGDYDLIASCGTINGGQKLSSVSLNQVLTNNNGGFGWVSSGGNFAASARNVRLTEGGTVLEAELADVNGRWTPAKTWLNEMIGNVDGELKYVG